MPRKHTRKINIRGGGEETIIQKQIREELERILSIFTLDITVRKEYTVSSFFDNKSNGAKLIVALRDLYSSRSIWGSKKARTRNELIVRIIKLLIDEPNMFRQIPPNLPGYQFKFRPPIILPPRIPLVDGIFAISITYLSFLLNEFRQCIGNLCNVARYITDTDAYAALTTITETIGFTQADQTGQPLFECYNELKDYFDKNTNVSNEEYKKIAVELLETIVPYVRLRRNNDGVPINRHEHDKYLENISESRASNIVNLIKKKKLLYFISDLNYDLALSGIFIDYDDDYIRRCLDAIKKVKNSKEVKDSKKVKNIVAGETEIVAGETDIVAGEKEIVAGEKDVNSMGGANIRHRKKTIKKQRRHNRSTLLLKKI
jgi:hypothetical protein